MEAEQQNIESVEEPEPIMILDPLETELGKAKI
jgi:hypothetical protein